MVMSGTGHSCSKAIDRLQEGYSDYETISKGATEWKDESFKFKDNLYDLTYYQSSTFVNLYSGYATAGKIKYASASGELSNADIFSSAGP